MVDRADAVLVLIDMQESLAAAMQRRDSVAGTAALLARVARLLDVPVIVTRQYPEGLGDTVAEVAEAVADLAPIDKVTFSCPAEPAFADRLASLGRRQVVLAGMETHICVTQTALALVADGYRVHVVADAVCSRRDADHEIALDRLRAASVEVTVAESVIYEALGRAGTQEFRAALGYVKAHPLGG
jgi:nicotinamidase-related amidase